jgi:threonine dehydrogenase-like Zn-dependent dehydrogenase
MKALVYHGAGSAVEGVKKGDLVCLPFNIGCGHCKNCEGGLTGYCLTANPGTAGPVPSV